MLAVQPVVINLSGDWTSATVEVLALIVTVLSVVCAFLAYTHQRKRAKKAAACDLAKYYADDVIEKNPLIANVFSRSKLDEYIKSVIPEGEINRFDRSELAEILEKKSIPYDEFMKKVHAIDPSVIFICRMNLSCNLAEREKLFSDFTSSDENTVAQNKTFLSGDFFQDLSMMLNQLEWFCMSCRYGLADEKIIYQSLHQTFLATVRVLYPFICRPNLNNEDKFYTNIIWLYRRWSKRHQKIKGKTDKRRQKYLDKANAVKARIFSGSGV